MKCQSTNCLFWHYICSACVKIINADNDSNKDVESSKGKEDNESTFSSLDSDNHPATDNNITNQKTTQNVEELKMQKKLFLQLLQRLKEQLQELSALNQD